LYKALLAAAGFFGGGGLLLGAMFSASTVLVVVFTARNVFFSLLSVLRNSLEKIRNFQLVQFRSGHPKTLVSVFYPQNWKIQTS
jgi:hypothetical protein